MKGEQVRRIRTQLGFTQEELAKQVGVHKNTVARWERDELSIREIRRACFNLLRETVLAAKMSRRKGPGTAKSTGQRCFMRDLMTSFHSP